MAPLRWGICSAGWISKQFTYNIKSLDQQQHQALGVAARELERAQDFAQTFGIPKAYGCYQELADDKDLDVIYIGTLHTEHHRLCLMFLEAGKHVLCEKPCTMNLKELNDVLKKAKEKKLFFMEAIWSRFVPVYHQLRSELSVDTIGAVQLVEVVTTMDTEHVPRLNRREMGGGGLIDIGIYGIQLICHVFKEKPQKIHAVGHLLDSGVDGSVSVTLFYSNRRMAHLTVCIHAQDYGHAVICGKKGHIEIQGPMHAPTCMNTPTQKYELPMRPSSLVVPSFEGANMGYQYEADATRHCIKQGLLEHPLMCHDDSVMIKEILDEARRQIGVVYDQDK